MITLDETVEKMNQSLANQAKVKGISKENIQDAFEEGIHSLDDLFKDGGMTRCEYYDDVAIPYALQFGEFDSDEFHEARTEVLDKAVEKFGY